MSSGAKVFLLAVTALAVATATVHVFAPGGIPALAQRLFPPKDGAANSPKAPAAAPTASAEASPREASSLRSAEIAYDDGEFDRAVDLYTEARVEAQGEARRRATSGLHKSVLAWALTFRVPPPNPMPADADGEVARRQAEVEAQPSERAWYDLTVYAAGAGLARKLPYFARQSVDCAQVGGPVQKRLLTMLEIAGTRTGVMRDALEAQGLLPETVHPVAVAAAPTSGGRKSTTTVGREITPPTGKFSAAMKARLVQAVELEKKGTAEYALTGPDEPKRREHRRVALQSLVAARDIYNEAEEEDPDSGELGRRITAVIRMIADLHKESALGD